MASGEDEPYYSISFISYAYPRERAGFFGFAGFLAKSMAALFDARPHWGKICPLDAKTASRLYPRLDEFRAVCTKMDRAGVFRNSWIAEVLFPDE